MNPDSRIKLFVIHKPMYGSCKQCALVEPWREDVQVRPGGGDERDARESTVSV